MLIYNTIPDLAAMGILTLLVITYSIVLFFVLIQKKKVSNEVIFNSIVIGILLTFLSMLVANGNMGGDLYHERFGWPGQMYSLSRNLSGFEKVSPVVPFGFTFNFFKIAGNLLFYSGLTFILFVLTAKSKKK